MKRNCGATTLCGKLAPRSATCTTQVFDASTTRQTATVIPDATALRIYTTQELYADTLRQHDTLAQHATREHYANAQRKLRYAIILRTYTRKYTT
eukprot:650856-Pyramimonas_sp.AAC.1